MPAQRVKGLSRRVRRTILQPILSMCAGPNTTQAPLAPVTTILGPQALRAEREKAQEKRRLDIEGDIFSFVKKMIPHSCSGLSNESRRILAEISGQCPEDRNTANNVLSELTTPFAEEDSGINNSTDEDDIFACAVRDTLHCEE